MLLERSGRPLLAVSLSLLFFVVTTWITWAKHDTYNSRSTDMPMYTQLV